MTLRWKEENEEKMKRWGLLIAAVLGCGIPAAMAQVPLNLLPQRAVGHTTKLQSNGQPNLVEGRELNRPQGVVVDAVRRIVWVADTANNRVLGWRNASAFQNGARADFVLGQRDAFSTDGQGPGTSFSGGLFAPVSVAVDPVGNVYVADAGNSRILRYPRPAEQSDQLPDMVIGQPDFRTRAVNSGGGPTDKTLALFGPSGPFKATIMFDAQNNLWVTDAGNHRILRYPASALGENASSTPSANMVIGQPDFATAIPLSADFSLASRIRKNGMREPSGLAFDQAGRMYVADLLNRVVVYRPPFTVGQDAARIMGIEPPVAEGQPPRAGVNEYTIGVVLNNGARIPADSVFTIGNVIFVVDTPTDRILRYDAFDSWPAETAAQFSPPARAVIGQDTITLTQLRPNRGQAEPGATGLSSPGGAFFANGETFVADTGNNRVLVFGDISTGPAAAAGAPYNGRRVLGQDNFESRSANLIEGREFAFNYQGAAGAGLTIDTRSNPPRLYVADFLNNRVLGFADARRVRSGDKADVVIGQPDMTRALVNFPTNDPNQRNASGLNRPSAVAVDKDGNVWVSDFGNARVLRFPDPFANPGGLQQADMVIGQTNFSNKLQDATARTMSAPWGLAFSVDGTLFVSDAGLNRVLQFVPPFNTGMAASRVFGQPDFVSTNSGSTENRLNEPRHLAFDTDDRLYVADYGNNRIQIFSRAPNAGTDPRAAFTLSREISRPVGVFVSSVTGEVWVASGGTGLARRYPNFDRLIASGDTSDFQLPTGGPIAITADQFGNLYIADGRNRIAIHYPRVTIVNGANYLPRVTPGMVATLQTKDLNQVNFNYSFTDVTAVNGSVPLVRALADRQVTINGQPTPMYFVSPFQINFQMPIGLPTSGTVELQVEEVSSGRIIAASDVVMDVASPGLFTLNGSGTGQLAAINVEDNNTINGIGDNLKPVGRGKIITLYGTGQGPIQGAPPDGSPATGIVNTDVKPIVIVNGVRLTDANILYSGLAPGLVGVWQLNVRIPDTVPPNARILVVIVFRDIPSNNPQAVGTPNAIVTTIAVQ